MILAVSCDSFSFILNIVSYLFKILQWIIPVVLILLITIDMAKVVANGDEKQKKDSTSKAVRRLIYAIIIFFVPVMVKLVFRIVGNSRPVDVGGGTISTTSWVDCFNKYFN